MTSCSSRELGPRFFMSVGMSCIRFLASFLRFLLRIDADCSRAALSITSKLDPVPAPAVEYDRADHSRVARALDWTVTVAFRNPGYYDGRAVQGRRGRAPKTPTLLDVLWYGGD